MATSNQSASTSASPTAPRQLGGPIGLFVSFFSSIWLGVILLSLLFVYSAIGSSGVPTHPNIFAPAHWLAVRQMRPFEMTEFEWFHWWPFTTLIALICLNLVVATLKRIKLTATTIGVWMIHSGIIILCIGSVWYFATKVEGDAPVVRREIAIEAPGAARATIIASPGKATLITSEHNAYVVRVTDIDPQWELLSGDDKGKKAYKVSVSVQPQAGEPFIRQLIAGFPQYTEDLMRSDDPQQPFVRAIKKLGKPLVNEEIKLSLDYQPQEFFYLADQPALYLREVGQTQWAQRPIRGLPRYNDYIASTGDVWLDPADEALRPHPIDVQVPPHDPNDPMPQTTFTISRFLRYAVLESRRRPSDAAPLNPALSVLLRSAAGAEQNYQLVAFDSGANTALEQNLRFFWATSAEQVETLKNRPPASISFRVPGAGVSVERPIARIGAEAPFETIEGTDYSYRIESVQDNMNINGRSTSIAILEIKTPTRTFKRWVFDDPTMNRDMADETTGHGEVLETDTGLETTYRPAEFRPPLLLVGGPAESDLLLIVTRPVSQPVSLSVRQGQSVPLTEGVSLVVEKFAARTIEETKPLVVPRDQRDRDVKDQLSMIRLDLSGPSGGPDGAWLRYHNFMFDRPEDVLRRLPFRPDAFTLPDGRQIEFMFSRARLRLPAPVALDDFKVATHIGGFTGASSSILDWTSVIKFDQDGQWTDGKLVSVNKPAEHMGYWFFQAMWDPPDMQQRFEGDPGSRGLNYTVLGVGNRNGVQVQLAGCIIAVLGMIFAFYIKPVIKRRRQQKVYAQTAGQASSQVAVSQNGQSRSSVEKPVGAAWKVQP